jgi:hypothetical protein
MTVASGGYRSITIPADVNGNTVGVVLGSPNRLAVDIVGPIVVSTTGTPQTTTDSQDLAVGSQSASLAPGVNWEPRFVSIHFDVILPGDQTLVITFDSGSGAAFDTVFETVTLGAGTQDFLYAFPPEILLTATDAILVTLTNTGTPAVIANTTIRGES